MKAVSVLELDRFICCQGMYEFSRAALLKRINNFNSICIDDSTNIFIKPFSPNNNISLTHPRLDVDIMLSQSHEGSTYYCAGSIAYLLYAQICYGDPTFRIKCCYNILFWLDHKHRVHISCLSRSNSSTGKHCCWELHKQHVRGQVILFPPCQTLDMCYDIRHWTFSQLL